MDRPRIYRNEPRHRNASGRPGLYAYRGASCFRNFQLTEMHKAAPMRAFPGQSRRGGGGPGRAILAALAEPASRPSG